MKEHFRLIEETNSAETKIEEARSLLREFCPGLLPRQETVVLLSPPLKGDESDGIYLGQLRNKHYIYINPKNGNHMNDVFTLAHELVHQWPAEVLGHRVWWGFDP